ncbi:winged helix-turn-helix domain-containing protein [Terriglobus aquaticus]|uniref:Winged helix-turn-helix domain-containing protein n=1 Tax=Terriglobus aquaticus TaxID=940139 RepID=A0ABW9KK43_9BACT|nr:winged helix-turn-helix domain-containing protein [Terriglobus aquaticus]
MLYRFGDFELDEEGFSLTLRGRRVSLEPRALSVLFILAGNAGKLLDKQTLLEAVWKDTFVEETTLTRAIAIIRKQLGDDARAPHFIETVPTRGYRFIAPVERSSAGEAIQPPVEPQPAATEQASSSGVALEQPEFESVPQPPNTELPSATPATPVWNRPRLFTFAAVGGALLAAAVSSFLLWRSHSRQPLSTRDTLVLADFVNTTGDAAFDIALRQGLLVQLDQSPVLRLASDTQVRKTLKRMGQREDAPLTGPVAREVCQRLGGSVVLDGSITRLGDTFVIGLHARRCSSGEEVDAEQVQLLHKEDALEAIGKIATQFRTRLGEATQTLHDFDTPLAEATTPSLEALSAFSRGMQAFNTKGSSAAIPLFRYATELDPEFAWAHAWLGRMYADLGREDQAMESTRRAHELRNRASERERFTIDVSYDLLVTGNLKHAKDACEAWIQMYPRDVYPRAFLSTSIYPAYGQYERMLEESRDIIELDPDFVVGYRNAAVSLIALNRADEAAEVLQRATQRKLFLASFVTDEYRIAYLKGDEHGMEQALQTAPRNPWLLYYHAATLARAGQVKQAEEFRSRALDLARQSLRQDMEAEFMVGSAFTDLFYGDRGRAAQTLRAALKLPSGRYTQASAALAMAILGNAPEATSMARELGKRFPEDTALQNNCIPAIDAAVALHQNKPQVALDLLNRTSQFGLSLPLYATFLRGQAQLALRHGPDAAASFRAIVDHPGLVLNDPLGSVAQMHLAQANALSGSHTSDLATADLPRQSQPGSRRDIPPPYMARELAEVR